MVEEDFLRNFRENPDQVLSEYDLTTEEKKILKSGNERKLRKLIGDMMEYEEGFGVENSSTKATKNNVE